MKNEEVLDLVKQCDLSEGKELYQLFNPHTLIFSNSIIKKAGNEKSQTLFIHLLFTYTLTTTTSTTSGCSTTDIPQNTTCFSTSVY